MDIRRVCGIAGPIAPAHQHYALHPLAATTLSPIGISDGDEKALDRRKSVRLQFQGKPVRLPTSEGVLPMIRKREDIPHSVMSLLQQGTVLPAHPLALDARRQLDREHQRALSRYYLDAGVGGLALGVHTTQFAIREFGLYEPVLRIAAETVSDWRTDPPC